MIENYNESKTSEFADYKKYIGVGSINVLCVNPDNAKLKMYGWNVADNADEPQYVIEKERDGKIVKSTRVCLLVQIRDLEDHPIIPLNFWIGPEISQSGDGSKAKIIDNFGRTAWGTRDELKAHKIPEYKSGPANISSDYRLCHRGEEELVTFIFKYLNITPLQVFSRTSNGYENTKNPGKFAFDNWNAMCAGDMKELEGYLKLQPQNCMKVVFGIRTNDDNKTFQSFINTRYIGNSVMPDKNTGDYASAQNIIDKYMAQHPNSTEQFSASPIRVWEQTASVDIKDNSGSMFDDDGNFVDSSSSVDDLPFGF